MALDITPDDLRELMDVEVTDERAEALIRMALGMALRVAPCLNDDDLPEGAAEAARSVILQSVLRWHEAGSGALTQKSRTAGPFTDSESYDTRQTRRGMFWPSEIKELQGICVNLQDGGAYSVDTVPGGPYAVHSVFCAVHFGGHYCSCGSDINGLRGPLYEGGVIW